MKQLFLFPVAIFLFVGHVIYAQGTVVDLYSFPDKTAYNYTQVLVFANEGPGSAKMIIDHTAQVQAANPHPMGLWYDNARKSWLLYNEDMAPFPKDIHLQGVLRNYTGHRTGVDHFVTFLQLKLTASQIQDYYAVIDDPALNTIPDLRIQVTHLYNNDGTTTGMYNADYPMASYDRERKKWILYNKNKTPLKAGLVFNLAAIATENKTVPKQQTLAVKKNAVALLKQEKIKFRVTINGFTCHTPTVDHMLEVDGKGDEVFFGGITQYFNLTDNTKTGPVQRVWSVRYGDINSEEGRMGLRIKAGSKPGNLGGVQAADQFPIAQPWKRNAPVYKNTLPLLLTEGVLIKGGNAALVVPSVWEFDGTTEEEQALNNFASSFTKAALYLGGAGVLTVTIGPLSLPFYSMVAMHTQMSINRPVNGEPVANLPMFVNLDANIPELNVLLSKSLFGDAKDRPVGMTDKGDVYAYTPVGIMLNYETAEALAVSDLGFGKGVVPLRFRDAPTMAGDYTIYIQVEVLPDNSHFSDDSKVEPYGVKTNPRPYRMQNVYSGKDMGDGSIAFQTSAAPTGKWFFEPAGDFSDVYYIRSASKRYLSIPVTERMPANGTNVVFGAKQANMGGRWKVVSNSDGTYSVINMFARMALIMDGPTGSIKIWENRANPEQRWVIGR